MATKLTKILYNHTTLWIILVLVSAGITLQNIFLANDTIWGGDHTHYNNYIIFKQSFFHLLENKNLFAYYPEEQYDLYKYSPTFALFMGLFAYLPETIGLFLWNLLNSLVLFYALATLKNSTPKKLAFIVLYILMELVVSLGNSQSNALLTGLIILSFNAMEKDKPAKASLFILLGAFIKLFTLPALLLFFFYPKKLKFVLFSAMWGIILILLPVVVITFSQLYGQYLNWLELLSMDRSGSVGVSLYQIVEFLSGINPNKNLILVVGVFILGSPLFFVKNYTEFRFRINYVCLLLLWMVVFNHKAESPSYTIAMVGCAIWAISNELKRTEIILLTATLIFTSVFSTDVVPIAFRKAYLNVEFVKAFMPIIFLGVVYVKLITYQKKETVLLAQE